MARYRSVTFTLLLCCLTPSAPAQQVTEGNSVSGSLRTALDAVVDIGELDVPLGKLGDELTKRINRIPISIDDRGIRAARLTPDTIISATIPKLPLRAALRRLLHRRGLHAVAKDGRLVITANFSELTRSGIGADQWVDEGVQLWDTKYLDQEYSIDVNDTPLRVVVGQLSEMTGRQMIVDHHSLVEIGLTDSVRLSLTTQKIKLRHLLARLLRPIDCHYLIEGDVLQITTTDNTEDHRFQRIYFLEGLGVLHQEADRIRDLLFTCVAPDTWDAGNSAEIMRLSNHEQNRPGLLVTTTLAKHEQIAELIAAMRQSHVGPDPIFITD